LECHKIVEFLKASWEERKQYYTEEWDMTNVPNFILTTLNQTILNSNWEVEQIKLLYKILSQKKITIINKIN